MTDAPTVTVEDLESLVETALWNYYPVRDSLSDLRVDVTPDGRVAVSGPVRSGLIKDGVLETLRWVPGVTGIVDGMVADSELEIEVAVALARDPRLEGLPPGAIAIHSHLGEVTLLGRLRDDSMREIATEVASQVSGVQRVYDRTVAR
jgi:osmotically-inducible protein OsmY